jgi:hypothetical protein
MMRQSSHYKFGKIAPLDELPMYDTKSLILKEDEEDKGAFSFVSVDKSTSGAGTGCDWQEPTTTTTIIKPTATATMMTTPKKETHSIPPPPTVDDATASLYSSPSSTLDSSIQSSSSSTTTSSTSTSFHDDFNHAQESTHSNNKYQEEHQSPPSSPGVPIIDTRESFEVERDNLVMVKKDLIRSVSMKNQITDYIHTSANSHMLVNRPVRQSVLEPTKFDAFSLGKDTTILLSPRPTPSLVVRSPSPPPIASLSSSISPPSRSFPPSIPRQERREIRFASLVEEEEFPEPPDDFMLDKTWDPDDTSVDSQTPSLDGEFNYQNAMTDAEKHEFS